MAIDTKELKKRTEKLNILFVEDDPVVQMLTRQILAVFFNELDTATNGQEGLDIYAKTLEDGKPAFDIVITDVSMPKLSGIEMARKIVAINPYQHFIFISAHQEDNFKAELDGKGFYTFTTKPVSLDSLKEVFHQSCLQLDEIRKSS